MTEEKACKEVENNTEMTIKDYIKWGFILIAAGLAFAAIGVWMYSDGSTFFGLFEIVGGIIAFIFAFLLFKKAIIRMKETITNNQKKKFKLAICGLLVLSVAVVCLMFVQAKNTDAKVQPVIDALNGTSWNWYGEYGDKWVFHENYIDEEDLLYEKKKSRNWEVISVRDGVMKISVEGFRVTFEVFYTEENGVYTIDMLRNQHYDSYEYEYAERLKDHSVLLEELDTFRTEAFAGNDPMKMIEYIEWVKANSEDIDDVSIIEYFPYQDMVTYFETHGAQVITKNGEGGYYDSIQDQFVGESYWYSPLDNKKVSGGDIGRYHYSKDYTFYGDFMTEDISKRWYDSGPNEYDQYLYFRGEHILNSNGGSVWKMMEIFSMDESVYLVDAYEDFMIVALEEGAITIIHDYEMVMIAYE